MKHNKKLAYMTKIGEFRESSGLKWEVVHNLDLVMFLTLLVKAKLHLYDYQDWC